MIRTLKIMTKKYQKLLKIGKKIQRKDEIPVKNYSTLKISSGL